MKSLILLITLGVVSCNIDDNKIPIEQDRVPDEYYNWIQFENIQGYQVVEWEVVIIRECLYIIAYSDGSAGLSIDIEHYAGCTNLVHYSSD